MTLTAIKLPGTRPVPGRQRPPDHRHQRVKPSEMNCIARAVGGLGISCGLSKERARGLGRCRAAGNPGTHRVAMTSSPLRAASLVSVRLCCSARVWVAETKTAGPVSPQPRAVQPTVSPMSGSDPDFRGSGYFANPGDGIGLRSLLSLNDVELDFVPFF